jgi:hypothetical protein
VIRLTLCSDGPDFAPCGTLVVGLYAGERPPRGEAGMADWRLGGAISRAILSGHLDTKLGSTILMPPGKLPASRLLLVGLGAPSEFKSRAMETVIATALAKLAGLREEDFAMAIPGTKPFPAPKDAADVIGEHLLGSLATAAKSAKITILGPADHLLEIRDWIRTATGPVTSHVVLDEARPTSPDARLET